VRPIDFTRLDQLYDLRIVLEQASIDRLAHLTTPSPEVDALKAVWLVPSSERLTDARAVGELDEQFHATLARATGNEELARVHWDVTERIRVVRRLDFTRPDRIEATYAEHAKILRQIIQRKAEPARALLKAHIELSKVEVRKISLAALHEARQRAVDSA
jgi:DNA-binding GntR family transcriptional regulator